MDIYQALKGDHQETKQLFADIEGSSGKTGDSREKIFSKLKDALEVHSKAEEEVFYTPLKKKDATREKIEHATKEHLKVTEMLNEIESMETEDPQWLKKVSKLKDDIQHHIQEEEGDIFTQAQGIFSKQQAEEMAEQFKRAKKKTC
jgi:hemerythrin-like domain-containing protein